MKNVSESKTNPKMKKNKWYSKYVCDISISIHLPFCLSVILSTTIYRDACIDICMNVYLYTYMHILLDR